MTFRTLFRVLNEIIQLMIDSFGMDSSTRSVAILRLARSRHHDSPGRDTATRPVETPRLARSRHHDSPGRGIDMDYYSIKIVDNHKTVSCLLKNPRLGVFKGLLEVALAFTSRV